MLFLVAYVRVKWMEGRQRTMEEVRRRCKGVMEFAIGEGWRQGEVGSNVRYLGAYLMATVHAFNVRRRPFVRLMFSDVRSRSLCSPTAVHTFNVHRNYKLPETITKPFPTHRI